MIKLKENGKTLKEIRLEKKLTIYDLSERMGVTAPRVSRIENSDGLTYELVIRYLEAVGYYDD